MSISTIWRMWPFVASILGTIVTSGSLLRFVTTRVTCHESRVMLQHPSPCRQRYACHVFLGESSTRCVAQAYGWVITTIATCRDDADILLQESLQTLLPEVYRDSFPHGGYLSGVGALSATELPSWCQWCRCQMEIAFSSWCVHHSFSERGLDTDSRGLLSAFRYWYCYGNTIMVSVSAREYDSPSPPSRPT